MAQRHWVGGTASWNGTAGSKWALTNGGAGGQAEPTTADDVFFDSGSGAGTVTVDTGVASCLSLNFTGFTGTFAGSTVAVKILGGLTLGSGMTFTFSNQLQFWATSGTWSITSNGISMACAMDMGTNGTGATWNLADNLVGGVNKALTSNGGVFNAANFNVTFGSVDFSASNARTLTMGSGTWTMTGSSTDAGFQIYTQTGLTFTATTAVIKFTDSGNNQRVLDIGGLTIGTFWSARGASTGNIVINRNISGNPTFSVFKDTGTAGHKILFRDAGTYTFTTTGTAGFTTTGSAGNLIYIGTWSSGGGAEGTQTHTLSMASGTVSNDYMNIQHSIAQGGASWYAGANSTNNQATATAGSGWVFTAPSTAPTVTTQAASSIAGTTATGNGNVTSDGGATVTERGVCWGTSLNPTTSDSKATAAGTTGAYTASITGLSLGTLYHYRAYAINSVGTSYGADTTFTTLSLPTVTTQAASSVLQTTATGNANLTNLGGDSSALKRGVVYATATHADPGNLAPASSLYPNKVEEAVGGYTTGAFTEAITGLVANTTYYLRGYAQNGAGYSYGAEITFTTTAAGPANEKTWNGLAEASVKTVNGLAIASVKTDDGLS